MDYGYFDSEVIGFDDATGLPIFDRAQDSDFMAAMFASVWGSGVYPNPSDNLQVMERDDSTFGVKIMPGRCWIQGRFGKQEDAENIELAAASTTADRIDNIVVELSKTNRTVTIKKVDGVSSSAPAAPALVRTSDTFQICLAQCRVRKNAVKVNQSDIIDTRPNADLCGYVTGIITQVDTTTIFNQYSSWLEAIQAEWQAWWTGQQGGIDGYMLMSTYDPSNSGSVVDSEKLGGQLPEYYRDAEKLGGKLPNEYATAAQGAKADAAMPKSGGTFTGTVTSRALIPYENNTSNIGSSDRRYRDIYCFSQHLDSLLTFDNASSDWKNIRAFTTIGFRKYDVPSTKINIDAANLAAPSSRRYKENIQTVTDEDALKILALRPVTFDWKKGSGYDGCSKSFIAEEAAQIDERYIYRTANITKPEVSHIDEETGERIVDAPAEYEMRIEGLNQNPILCDVVALCQRQQRQIDALSALLVSKGILTQEEIDGLGDNV